MSRITAAPFFIAAVFAAMAAGLFAAFVLNIVTGSAQISAEEVVRAIMGFGSAQEEASVIICRIRAPRACAALAGGAALGVAGLLLQSFFGNPIVEPYILGISSGSSLFVAMVVLGGIHFGFSAVTPWTIFTAAFLGALCITVVTVLAARMVRSMIALLVIGVMCGYVCGAATGILSAFAEHEAVANFSMWTMGSFAGFAWPEVRVMAGIVMPVLLLSFCLAKSLNALRLGDNYASSMGVDVGRVRCCIILVSSLLTSAVTAFAGPVSFIGLAVPHICRMIFRSTDNRVLMPASALCGALVCCLCDFAARNLLSPIELPLGSITAMLGAPIVVWLIASRKNPL